MTCLVCIKNKKGKIVMGADRRVSWGSSQYQESVYAKVKKANDIIMSFCGDCTLGNLIVNVMKRPKLIEDTDVYMYYVLPDKIKRFLIERGHSINKELFIPDNKELEILIAVDGRLFSLSIDNNVILVDELAIPFCSGSGSHVAWGSLLTTENIGIKARERVYKAIEVSSKVVHSVDSRIDIEVED